VNVAPLFVLAKMSASTVVEPEPESTPAAAIRPT
jgi:hypothetical protein